MVIHYASPFVFYEPFILEPSIYVVDELLSSGGDPTFALLSFKRNIYTFDLTSTWRLLLEVSAWVDHRVKSVLCTVGILRIITICFALGRGWKHGMLLNFVGLHFNVAMHITLFGCVMDYIIELHIC